MSAFRFFGALASSAAIFASIAVTPAAAYFRLPAASSTSSASSSPTAQRTVAGFDRRDVTFANYGPRKMYLPGKWTVSGDGTGTGTIVFKKGSVSVRLGVIAKDQCALSPIRIAALKAWGGRMLKQSQSQIRLLVLGRSTYRGFSWALPENEYRWCLSEDRRYATEVSAVNPDRSLLTFLQTNFVRQLAVRNAIR